MALVGAISGISGAGLMAVITTALSDASARDGDTGQIFAALVLLVLLAGYFSRVLTIKLAQGTNYSLRMDLCRQIAAMPLRRHEILGKDKVLATLIEDVQAISNALLAVPRACINITVVIGCLCYLAWLSPPVLASLVVYLILAIASVVIPERRGGELLKLARIDWNGLMERFRDLSEGEKELRLHRARREAFLNESLTEAASRLRDRRIASSVVFAQISSWTQVLYFIFIGMILFLFKGIDDVALIGYTLTVLYMRAPISVLVDMFPVLARAGASVEQVLNMGFELEAVAQEPPPMLASAAVCRSLELRGITHSYYREREDREFTLGPIDMSLEAGQLTFLVGGNGSGKTTLAKLMAGLYIPEDGEVVLDGRPIDDDSREWYRQHFSVVFSNFHLFDTLHGLASEKLDAQAEEYLRRLQIAHKVEVKDGVLSTTALSQGQRKRLALLTAYLEDRPIYIFDEWAADQDPIFKKVFYNVLLPELQQNGRMVVVISHDDSYYHLADRMFKLDFGKIVAGRPDNFDIPPPDGDTGSESRTDLSEL